MAWYRPDLLGLGAGVVVSLFAWLRLLGAWLAIIRAERGIMDPTPTPEPTTLRVEVAAGPKLSYLDLPIDESSLVIFAKAIIDGSSLTESAWLGSGLFRSRNAWVSFRDVLVKRGWLEWNSPGTPARGLHLTPPGRAALKYISDYPNSV